jgi:hypothetical protein
MRKYLQAVGRVLLFALCCVLLFSCTDIEHGVFWSIEHEEKIPDNSLPNDIGVYGIIKIPNLGYPEQSGWHANGRYYLAGASLFFRDAAPGSDWK